MGLARLRFSIFLLLGAIAVFLSDVGFVPIAARAQSQNSPAGSLPTFSSRSELVLLPVIVTKHGKHVPGLKREDFKVLEDGVAQRISSFEEVTATDTDPHWKAMPPGIYSNVMDTDAPPKRVTVLLIDQLNPAAAFQELARDALIKFLKQLGHTHEPLMLLVLNGSGVHVVHDYTIDTSAMIEAIRRVEQKKERKGDFDPELTTRDAVADLMEQRIRNEYVFFDQYNQKLPMSRFDLFYKVQSAQVTLTDLQEIARALAGVPGRKTLIWPTKFALADLGDCVQAGIASEARRISGMNRLFKDTIQELAAANIAVYPVQMWQDNKSTRCVNGPVMRTPVQPRPAAGVNGNGRFAPAFQIPVSQSIAACPPWELSYQEQQQAEATEVSFAEHTGGNFCLLGPHMEHCFQDAMDDSSAYYLIAYHPQAGAAGWRRLKVEVKGGASARTRTGYYFGANESAGPIDIAHAIVSPMAFTGIPVAVHWTRQPAGANDGIAQFELFVPPSGITFDGAEQNHFHLKVVATAPEKGLFSHGLAKEIGGTLSPEGLQVLLHDGLIYNDEVEVPAGAPFVRFVVRDEISGRMGSVTAPIKQP